MTSTIDLNADLGEGGAFDEGLMSVVTSCNIACGGHAGDAQSMREALTLAKSNGVSPGAHPSFPDRKNFGRTASVLAGAELEAVLTEQIEDLKQVAARVGISLSHLKPHGALYNLAARDVELATSVVTVLKSTLPHAALVGPPRSELERHARVHRIAFVREGFADRAYEPDGALRDRKLPGALIPKAEAQSEQALSMATKGQVGTHSGKAIPMLVDTICVHGDGPDALAAARVIRQALEQSGIVLCAPS
ncbi:MAG: 5-oxoprolinase subunit PxpA [Pseudomonadota bacterium]